MKAKSILVVSDNFDLAKFMQETVAQPEYDDICFDFCYSSVNKNPQALVSLGMKQINVKHEVEQIIQSYQLAISAHCKQIFPAQLVNKLTCINIHPGLNPFNRGLYPQVFSIVNGLPVGVTIHLMNEKIDRGDIIISEPIAIGNTDTSLDVYNRIQDLEKRLIAEHMQSLIRGNYQTQKMTEKGNYNSIDDFKRLCQLNPDHHGTLKEHLDLLRALTHGEFLNAYFIDENGKKVYVRIILKSETA